MFFSTTVLGVRSDNFLLVNKLPSLKMKICADNGDLDANEIRLLDLNWRSLMDKAGLSNDLNFCIDLRAMTSSEVKTSLKRNIIGCFLAQVP